MEELKNGTEAPNIETLIVGVDMVLDSLRNRWLHKRAEKDYEEIDQALLIRFDYQTQRDAAL